MLLKNISARLHHIGNVSIAPGETKKVDSIFKGAYNTTDLVEVVEVRASEAEINSAVPVSEDAPKRRGRPPMAKE